jgi:hypothetical protein
MLPTPGDIRVFIGVQTDKSGPIDGVQKDFTLTVENTPEVPTIEKTSGQNGVVNETVGSAVTSAQDTGVRFRTTDGDGDTLSYGVQRQTAT